MKVKVGDNVLIKTGKFKGKTGKVMRTYQKQNRIVVEKVNIVTKHIRKTTSRPALHDPRNSFVGCGIGGDDPVGPRQCTHRINIRLS